MLTYKGKNNYSRERHEYLDCRNGIQFNLKKYPLNLFNSTISSLTRVSIPTKFVWKIIGVNGSMMKNILKGLKGIIVKKGRENNNLTYFYIYGGNENSRCIAKKRMICIINMLKSI